MWFSLYEAGVTNKLQYKFLLLVYSDRIASREATVEHTTASRSATYSNWDKVLFLEVFFFYLDCYLWGP